MTGAQLSLLAQAMLYTCTGLGHFYLEAYFVKVTPPWVPQPKWVNRLVGMIELALAAGLLWPPSRAIALWGILALLVAVFPVHIHMLQNKRASLGWSRWILWARLPVQGLLMAWALWQLNRVTQ